MKDNSIKSVIIVGSIILSIAIIYVILDKVLEKEPVMDEFLKNYEVNEYITKYVTDEDMAKIYLNDYIHTMYYDIESAYNLLDKEYRDLRFGNIENYKNYIYSLNFPTYEVVKYYVISRDEYIVFGVYDNNGNFYAFKTKGVLQYSVYLDDTTVEI